MQTQGGQNVLDSRSTAYGFSSMESNSMKSSNPHSGIYEADTSRTLDNNGGNPSCNQGGVAVVSVQGSMIGRADKNGPQGSGIGEDVSFTLNATDRHGVATVAAVDCRNGTENETTNGTLQAKANGGYSHNTNTTVRVTTAHGIGSIGFKTGNSAKARGIGAQKEKSPSLSADPGGNTVPAVCTAVDVYNQAITGDVTMPLRANKADSDHIPVCAAIAVDVYNQTEGGQVAPSLTAACGGTNTSGAKVMTIEREE